MLNLAEYRSSASSLADFLPWAALIAEGVVLNKDGSFQRTARFRGPDLDSVTPSELVSITHRLNGALRRLGSGWAIFVEAQRSPAQHYPVSQFADPVSALVDRERAEQFAEEGVGDGVHLVAQGLRLLGDILRHLVIGRISLDQGVMLCARRPQARLVRFGQSDRLRIIPAKTVIVGKVDARLGPFPALGQHIPGNLA